jgi:SOS-response transcriptional repressor LexA
MMLHPTIQTRPYPRPMTTRQADVLVFVRMYMSREGRSPTLREIGAGVGIRSTNAVSGHLEALQAKGHLSRTSHSARGLRLAPTENAVTQALHKLYQTANDALLRQGHVERVTLAMAVNRVTAALAAERRETQ